VLKFLLYEALTCAIWAIVIGSLGYYFGRAVERLLGRAAHIEKWGLLLLVIAALAIWGYHKWKERREDEPVS
jgi:membrane protein DedA with SNARE-associated domain